MITFRLSRSLKLLSFHSEINKDEKNTSTVSRPSLQTLSDLIFGLALSIGAIELIGQQPTGVDQVIESLSIFGFGFYLLVTVWYRYASIMKIMVFETTTLVTINLVLLFLVAIEPYLLNILILGSSAVPAKSINDPVSQLYAFDFGSIYVVLAYFLHQVVKQEKKLGNTKHLTNYRRYIYFLVIAAVFYISILPFFGNITFSYFSLRQLIWLSFLPIGVIFRIAGWFG